MNRSIHIYTMLLKNLPIIISLSFVGQLPCDKSSLHWLDLVTCIPQPVKIDLNKKLDPKQKTIQTLNIDAQGFRKTKNENPLTWKIGVTS